VINHYQQIKLKIFLIQQKKTFLLVSNPKYNKVNKNQKNSPALTLTLPLFLFLLTLKLMFLFCFVAFLITLSSFNFYLGFLKLLLFLSFFFFMIIDFKISTIIWLIITILVFLLNIRQIFNFFLHLILFINRLIIIKIFIRTNFLALTLLKCSLKTIKQVKIL